MVAIGKKLRQTRESKGYTLEDMEQQTKIHTQYLRALEEEQFDLLPSPFYARTFLKSYAKKLGLNDQALVVLYDTRIEANKRYQISPRPLLQTPMERRDQSATKSIPIVQMEQGLKMEHSDQSTTSTLIYSPPLTAAIYAKDFSPPARKEQVTSLLQSEQSELSQALRELKSTQKETAISDRSEVKAPHIEGVADDQAGQADQIQKVKKVKIYLWIFIPLFTAAIAGSIYYYFYLR